MGGMTVGSLITLGYGIQRFQLVGGPAWLNTDRFDINAISEDVPLQPTPPGTPNRMQLLVRSLLKERFALKTHNETHELPLSYLVMAREDRKLGERLRPSTIDCRALMAERAKAAKEGAPDASGSSQARRDASLRDEGWTGTDNGRKHGAVELHTDAGLDAESAHI
ncbi:MAG TPA: TIGR03435 family protein [Vicinamibacterales bacterium]|nr:TIGR03435 family protein [Vicinamibacterales bacterium]